MGTIINAGTNPLATPTAGPWVPDMDDWPIYIQQLGSEQMVALVHTDASHRDYQHYPWRTATANAIVIAAAPELRDELRAVLAGGPRERAVALLDRIDSAIARIA